MTENYNEIIYDNNVVEFVAVANQFCKVLEMSASIEKGDFIEISWKMLALLYQKAVSLPKIEPLYNSENEKFVTEQDWSYIKHNIATKLGMHESFVDVFVIDAMETSETESVGTSECFADIYQDLKDFLTAYEIGNEEIMLNALWEVTENFGRFWGGRVLALLSVFHSIRFNSKDIDNENFTGSLNSSDDYDNDEWN